MLRPMKWKRAMACRSKSASKMGGGRLARKCAGSSTELPVSCCRVVLGLSGCEDARENYQPLFFQRVVSG